MFIQTYLIMSTSYNYRTLMKKYIYLLFLLPAMGLMSTSCDDDDLPDVDFNVTISGGLKFDDGLYVVQGDELVIESITVTNNESNKNAAIGTPNFYWDGYLLGISPEPPHRFGIPTDDNTAVGSHILEIACPVYAVDKSIADAVLAYRVNVVASADDMPHDGGVSNFTADPKITKN